MALLCVLALALVPCAQGLYFTMPQGDKKCFIEEVPEETVVVGKYNLEVHDDERNVYVADPSVGIHITIKNPEGEEIMDKTYKDSPGRFAFTSAVPGEHVICLSTESVWFGGKDLRIHLDLAMGESSNDYDEIRKRDKLDDLQLRVRQLLDQVDQIQKEQAYQRVREARFRDTSESTNWRVVYWSVIQLAILLASGVWQMRHLKGFFQSKKLV
eukprot:comp21069_c0_seq1/m.28370 comp21069_c0_seq1/g.28370  ORF comp21069_c0_seq1/g.28370 comp21069_c0_seq1/m.28370 type:complete len:213 (-) comp21069_c0_seq1:156-794(-)